MCHSSIVNRILGKSVMMSAGNRTFVGLQVMRAIAALMVAVHHAMEVSRSSPATPISPDWLTTAGAAGVDIFFVISGFIMMAVSFPPRREPDGLWSFLSKRIARIYPFYWVIVGIIVIGWQLGYFNTSAARNATSEDIIRSLLLMPSNALFLEVSWTLVHEMNFYLLFALMLWFRKPLVCFLGVTCLLLLQLALAGYASDSAIKVFLTRPIALEFCFGLAVGYAYLNGLLPKRIPWVLSAVAFAFMILAPFFIEPKSTGGLDADDRVWAWGLPAAVLVAACVNWSMSDGVVSKTWMLLGDASYAIYLLHPFVMMAYSKALGASDALLHAHQVPLFLAATVLSAALGVVAHVTVERPIWQAARRLLVPQQARTRTAAASAP